MIASVLVLDGEQICVGHRVDASAVEGSNAELALVAFGETGRVHLEQSPPVVLLLVL